MSDEFRLSAAAAAAFSIPQQAGLNQPGSPGMNQPGTPDYVGFANLPNQVHRKSVKKGLVHSVSVSLSLISSTPTQAPTPTPAPPYTHPLFIAVLKRVYSFTPLSRFEFTLMVMVETSLGKSTLVNSLFLTLLFLLLLLLILTLLFLFKVRVHSDGGG